MDPITLVTRRYQAIALKPDHEPDDFQRRAVRAWLRGDVVPLVGDYIGLPAFREHAAWPIRRLSPGANTPERRALDAVDAALVAQARALISFADVESVRRALPASNPPRAVLTHAVYDLQAGRRPTVVERQTATFDPVPGDLAFLREVSTRPWTDLVCPDDYFTPVGGMMLRRAKDGPPPAARFELLVDFNPELRPIGDRVTSSMFRRVDVWRDSLREVYQSLLAAWEHAGRPGEAADAVATAAAVAGDLVDRGRRLEAACRAGGDTVAREACAVLTQVYVGFHPTPDVAWLGLPDHVVAHGAAAVRSGGFELRAPEPADRVAAAVAALGRLDNRHDAGRAALGAVIQRGGLVLTHPPREAFWEGKPVDADWDKHLRPWELLVLLAAGAGGPGVTEHDLFASEHSRSAMPNLVAQLKRSLPASLARHIIPAGKGVYRLDLERSSVYVRSR
jgi:hypothetical protein